MWWDLEYLRSLVVRLHPPKIFYIMGCDSAWLSCTRVHRLHCPWNYLTIAMGPVWNHKNMAGNPPMDMNQKLESCKSDFDDLARCEPSLRHCEVSSFGSQFFCMADGPAKGPQAFDSEGVTIILGSKVVQLRISSTTTTTTTTTTMAQTQNRNMWRFTEMGVPKIDGLWKILLE